MPNRTQDKTTREIRVLLVGVRREDREALLRSLTPREPRFSLLAVASLAEALSCLEARQVDAVLCDWSAFPSLREALAGEFREAPRVPILVLVPPGAEARAAALLEREPAEFVLQAGNYQAWLPALLRRALSRQHPSSEEVAMFIRHEINNPLTGVLGNAELLLADASLPAKVRDRLATIITLAVRLRDVVRTLEARLGHDGRSLPDSLPAEPVAAVPLTRPGLR